LQGELAVAEAEGHRRDASIGPEPPFSYRSDLSTISISGRHG
jgi:hypothetical protein